MMLIDMIKEGSQMVNVPSYQAHSSLPSVFVSEQIASFNTPFYTFVPYCPDYINYCDLDNPERNVISSQFRGCLMVIWQEDYGYPIRIGHVDTTPGMSRKAEWDYAKTQFRFAYEFKPSDYIQPLPKGVSLRDCYGLYAIDQANRNIVAFSITTGDLGTVQNYVVRKKLVFINPLP